MSLKDVPRERLQGSGWTTRGYLPHFDGTAVPQFITLKLADAIPLKVIDRWKQELGTSSTKQNKSHCSVALMHIWTRDMEAVT
jgi:hypothetical protein